MSGFGLLLIDFQRDYFPKGRFELPGIELAAQNAKRVLEQFRKLKRPIFHVKHIELDPGATFFIPGTEGVEIHPELAPHKGEVLIEKNYPNAFRETELEQRLRQSKVTKIVFCGAMSNMCIDASVRAAFDFGFECQVIHDACAASDLEFNGQNVDAANVQAAFMGALASAYAAVLNSNELVKTI